MSATKYCGRCQQQTKELKRSWFDWNLEICLECSLHEKGCPNFVMVHNEGLTAIQAGFEPAVIGLASEDLQYLDSVAPKATSHRRHREKETPESDWETEYA